MENSEWLTEDIGQFSDELIIVDLPGQIELYTHYDIVPKLIRMFQNADYRVVVLYLMESQFLLDVSKYFGALLNATSAMLNLACPHLNIITKMDLIQKDDEDDLMVSDDLHPLHSFFYPDPLTLAAQVNQENPKMAALTNALAGLLDDFDMVSFVPLNIRKEDSITDLMSYIDDALQLSEQREPRDPDAREREAEGEYSGHSDQDNEDDQ